MAAIQTPPPSRLLRAVYSDGYRSAGRGGDRHLWHPTRPGRRSRPNGPSDTGRCNPDAHDRDAEQRHPDGRVAGTNPSSTPSTKATPAAAPSATSQPSATETISGVLTEAQTENPVPNSCVGWRSTSAADTDGSNYAAVDKGGHWSIPVNPQSIFFLFFYATSGGNCEGPVDTSSHQPSWYANQPFDAKTMPKDARAPMLTLTKVNSGDTGVVACLGTDELPSGPDACAKASTDALRPRDRPRPDPIAQACIFVFSDADGGAVGGAVADANGQWTVTDLPGDTTFAVGVVPPFEADGKACQVDGPPPAPADGELQPEFYANVWVDLTDEDLKADPYAFAVSAGAQVLKESSKGVDVCLTAESGDVKPRSNCDPPSRTISGVLRDGANGAPISGGCVAWRSTSADPTSPNQIQWVDQRGTWSIETYGDSPFYLAFYAAVDGNCNNGIDGRYQPSWYSNRAFAEGDTDPMATRPPRGSKLTAVSAGESGVVACLGADEIPTVCAEPDTTLSGRVTGYGPVPINQACVFVFDQSNAIGQAITDADGRWSVTGLPNDSPLTVGVLPPFAGKEGPCQFDDGGPPIPADGDLQPEVYANVWVDLESPALQNDPYGWGVERGAVVLENSTESINICLTADPGTVTPRSSCTPATSPPNPPPAPVSPAAGPSLADTGGPSPVLLLVGIAFVLGAGFVLWRARSGGAR